MSWFIDCTPTNFATDIWGRVIGKFFRVATINSTLSLSVDLENQIILQVEQRILSTSGLLYTVANMLAELDWFGNTLILNSSHHQNSYISFATAAQENRWVCPQVRSLYTSGKTSTNLNLYPSSHTRMSFI